MSFVNHVSARRLARRLLGSERMKLGGIYLKQVKEEHGRLVGEGRKS
jgi:hypothetical protein